jgi:hypothetical protein
MVSLRRPLGRALLVVASVLATLGMVECGVRVSGRAPLPATRAGGFRPDHPLLRLLRPSACEDAGSLDGPYFVEVCTNTLGLRDRDHREGENPRVLGVGDSFTFGWGVEENDTFLAHLERGLRIGLPEVKPGVWKAGLSYTSQVHQDVLLRHLYDTIRPDLVVLAFAEDNDIDENIVWNPNVGTFPEHGEIPPDVVEAYRESFRGAVARDWLFRHSALVRFFRGRHLRASLAAEVDVLDARLEAHGLTGAPLGRMVADEARRRFLQAFSDKYDEDWRVTEILLDRIDRYVAERHGKLVLVRIPSRMSVEDDAWAGAVERFCGRDAKATQRACGNLDRAHTTRRLAAYAGARGLAYVDPEDALRAAASRGEALYLPEDIHLSRLGHARLGERLAEAVVPELGGILPDAPVKKEARPRSRQVGAYWYPWYRADDWSSFTDYTPKGGAYRSTSTEAIARQLHWAERGELDFLMIELLADHNPESAFNNEAVDSMVNALIERRRRGYSGLQFAVLTDIFVGEAHITSVDKWLEATRSHLDQVWTRFVEPYRDAYVHVDGKPLVGIFSPDVAIDDPRFTIVRPYWVSHEQWKDWGRKSELIPFWDIAPQAVTDPRFVSVVPGYNDWRLERRPQVAPYVPRLGGRTFVEQWRRVFEIDPEVVLVYSFNEYFEQTQIEPTVEQGDRYLLLNQLLARRYKDGRPLLDSEIELLPEAIEPPPRRDEEKVAWLPIDDPRLSRTGLEDAGPGKAALHAEAEIGLDVDGAHAFVLGVGHLPTFERCTLLSLGIEGRDAEETRRVRTELGQLAVLRDSPVPGGAGRLKLVIRKVQAGDGCPDSARPILITGVARYPLQTAERLNFYVFDERVRLEGFWTIEAPPSGSFVWSRDVSTITVSGLTPGTRHQATLTFRDTAGFGNVELGPEPGRLERVVITPGKTATLSEPLVVSEEGTLAITMKTPTWRPSERFDSTDTRALGLAIRLITLDRVDGVSSPHDAR